MIDRNVFFSRQLALLMGRGVERTSRLTIDLVDDLMILMLQRIAAKSRESRQLGRIVVAFGPFRRSLLLVPPIAGCLVAGSTYFGMRVGIKVLQQSRKILAMSPQK